MRLVPGEQAVAAPVVMRAGRCDQHALVDAKRSATFPVDAGLDGQEPVLVAVTVDATGRAALQQLLADACPALGAAGG